MKPLFIIARTEEEYWTCKGHLKVGRAIHLTEPCQLDGVNDFILVKTGTWFKSDERVKLVAYAEARLEEIEAQREALKEEQERSVEQ